MRFVTLAVVTAIGIVIGVVMYLSQAVMLPSHERQHITKVIGGETIKSETPLRSASNPRSRVTDYDAMTPEEYNSKLPEAFRFGLQNSSAEADVAISPAPGEIPAVRSQASVSPARAEAIRSDAPVMLPPPPVSSMGLPEVQTGSEPTGAQTTIASAARTSAVPVETTKGTSVIPIESPPVMSHPNPHVSFETTQPEGTERGRTKLVVNK